jgi:hypothetical protein
MTIEEQEKYLQHINRSFTAMKGMLDDIQEKITKYPVYTQLEFIKPLESIIIEAHLDASNESDEFLNNYDGGDSIEV